MRVKTTAASVTAAVALLATPALAQNPNAPGADQQARGKTTAPGQLCKKESRKKTMRGKGKSPFAACIAGAKAAQTEIAAQADKPKAEQTRTAPGQLCRKESRKKTAKDTKSPFAACVTGAAKAQREQRS